MEQTTTSSAEAGKRPTFLTVLCILSFIWAGLCILGYITALTFMGAATVVASKVSEAGGEAGEAMNAMVTAAAPSAGIAWAYIIVGFVTTLSGLYGVIKMWKLAKIGFFIYVGSIVVGLIMDIVYNMSMGASIGIFGLVMTALFIVLYGLNLKHLK
jgi:hypothetical protein